MPRQGSLARLAQKGQRSAVWGLQARARKVEVQTKLEQLQQDIAELSSLTPEQAQAEEAATAALLEV